jgi:hypothetical protein
VTDKQGRAAGTSLVTAGSVLLGPALFAAGCASSAPPARNPASQGPASQSPAATTAEFTAMAARYMAIARPANRELDHEFDGFDVAARVPAAAGCRQRAGGRRGPGHPCSARPAGARYELTTRLTVVNPR